MLGRAARRAKYWPAYTLYASSCLYDDLRVDLARWIDYGGPSEPTEIEAFFKIFANNKEFRTVFFRRHEQAPRAADRHTAKALRRVFKPLDSLHLTVNSIGRSFFILHGDSTHILADTIGEGCLISQQVTIGTNFTEARPRLGNNVWVMPGAKVLGDIEIGDDVVIGANAVVTKDVPPRCVVVGVPGRIVKRDGKRVDEKL